MLEFIAWFDHIEDKTGRSIMVSKSWMWYIFPSSVTIEGLHIVIPLYVLFLNGTVSDVGIVIAVQYCGSAFGSIFWGKIIDKYHVKRLILLISFSAVTVSSFVLYFVMDLPTIFVLSAIVGFFIIGKNPITQMMVMETNPNNRWSTMFALTSNLTTFGSLAAFTVGMFWSQIFDLKPYFLFCAGFSLFSLFCSVLVGKSSFLERHTISESVHGATYFLRHHRMHFHLYFPKHPKLEDFKHITVLFKGKISHEIGLLYLTNFFFYFGSNSFFTILIPFLKHYEFSTSQIFAVYFIQTVVMMIFFFLTPRLVSWIGESRSVMISYGPRIAGILLCGALVPILIGEYSFFAAVVASCIMVVGFSIYSTSNSVIFFKAIPKGFEGRFLGVNSFMVGIGIFSASLISGFVSSFFGYTISFVMASILLVVSIGMFSIYMKNRVSSKMIHD